MSDWHTDPENEKMKVEKLWSVTQEQTRQIVLTSHDKAMMYFENCQITDNLKYIASDPSCKPVPNTARDMKFADNHVVLESLSR